ncbi:site-specific DNA-methyltransferase [Microbispora sp. ZYX-F-249]|uniref:Site-specific DNA-methyltransferase n=1 Tax=Microbispora maris TaxID=3144104 RepID=A0ABV0ANX1_9ACTN
MKKITAGNPEFSSMDLTAANLTHLKALFPEAFTEGKIDFEVLRQLLGGVVEEREEKYGLNWHGKRRARQLALTPSLGTLRPCPEESVDWDTTQNLMIEGDNLEVLKLLQKSYSGKVKLIYIDPPYNTGKDFIYRDDFRDNIKNYLRLTGQVDGNGYTLSSNTEASGRFHTEWLNMMYPRLKLARNLLKEDGGVILVSINDVEAASLRFMLDEIFGEENFLCQFIWNNEGNVDQQSKIKGVHEYVLAYARNLATIASPEVIDPNIEETSKLYKDRVENTITKNGPANPPSIVTLPKGFPAVFDNGMIKERTDAWPHILDDLVVKDGKLEKPGRVKSGWSSRNLLQLFIDNGCIPIQDGAGKETSFALTAQGAIYVYKQRQQNGGHVVSVIRNVGTSKQNSMRLANWGINFPYPKPLLLIQYLVQIFTRNNDNDVVMDFFAGSGTTGHAVYRLNSITAGNRRLVLVQLPEEATTESLAQITPRRLRMAAQEIREENPLFEGDLGFKMFKLDASNLRAWDPNAENLEQIIFEHVEHLLPGRNEKDLLYEVLIKRGVDLCSPIETRKIAGKTVYTVGGVLFACLGQEITPDVTETLALGIVEWRKELDPATESTVVFRDSAFTDDVAKANTTEILKQHGFVKVESL